MIQWNSVHLSNWYFIPIFLRDKPDFLREGEVIFKFLRSKNKLHGNLKIWALGRPWKYVLYKFMNGLFENWLLTLKKKQYNFLYVRLRFCQNLALGNNIEKWPWNFWKLTYCPCKNRNFEKILSKFENSTNFIYLFFINDLLIDIF